MTNVVKIPLDKGLFAIIDSEDYELVSQFNWYAKTSKRTHYAISTKAVSPVRMHRLIMGITDRNIILDHKNRNGLDNRKVNLRIATFSQNNANIAPRENSSSKYKGVWWNKEKKKWTAETRINNKKKHIGHFETEEEAALAYNSHAARIYGEFAFINIIS